MKIPQFKSFVDKTDYAFLEKVFLNNYIAEGPVAKDFHDQLLTLIGSKYGVFAPNGTLALYLALKAIGIKPGDEVIVQNTTFIASANAIEMLGATPVFVDIISYDNPSLDISKVKISTKTKAIMICHLFGTVCTNIEEVQKFCFNKGLLLIEDAAQTIGLTNSKKHCGTFGMVGTFSFYADKTITTGEGGFVVTDDEIVYEKMLYLRNQGRKKSGSFIHPEIGYNFRLTDFQAALGLSQLSKLSYIIIEKQKIYQLYKKYLKNKVHFLKLNNNFNYIPFRVVIFLDNAAKIIESMAKKGIEGRTVFYPLNQQPCFKNTKFGSSVQEDYNNSLECYTKGVCLPTWVGLSEQQIQYVSNTLLELME